jgi:hypothetical protein
VTDTVLPGLSWEVFRPFAVQCLAANGAVHRPLWRHLAGLLYSWYALLCCLDIPPSLPTDPPCSAGCAAVAVDTWSVLSPQALLTRPVCLMICLQVLGAASSALASAYTAVRSEVQSGAMPCKVGCCPCILALSAACQQKHC